MNIEDLTPVELMCLEITIKEIERTLKANTMAFKFTFEKDLEEIQDWNKHILNEVKQTKEVIEYFYKKKTAENKFKTN